MMKTPVAISLEDYTEIKVGMDYTRRKVDELAKNLNDHMRDEEKERKKIYRALIILGGILLLQLFGVTIDPIQVIKFFA